MKRKDLKRMLLRKRSSFFLQVVVCLLTAASLPAQKVMVDSVRGTDFNHFTRFTWATGAFPINDQEMNTAMAGLVKGELEAKGLRYVSSEQRFDAIVIYDAKLTESPQNSMEKFITINVRIADSRTNSVVWSAGGYTA